MSNAVMDAFNALFDQKIAPIIRERDEALLEVALLRAENARLHAAIGASAHPWAYCLLSGVVLYPQARIG